MKRIAAILAVAGSAVLLAQPASAHPICVYPDNTPHAAICVPNPLG